MEIVAMLWWWPDLVCLLIAALPLGSIDLVACAVDGAVCRPALNIKLVEDNDSRWVKNNRHTSATTLTYFYWLAGTALMALSGLKADDIDGTV